MPLPHTLAAFTVVYIALFLLLRKFGVRGVRMMFARFIGKAVADEKKENASVKSTPTKSSSAPSLTSLSSMSSSGSATEVDTLLVVGEEDGTGGVGAEGTPAPKAGERKDAVNAGRAGTGGTTAEGVDWEDDEAKIKFFKEQDEVGFDRRGKDVETAEKQFTFLMVVTACVVSFAHGSNDVSNSVGPFTAIIAIYSTHGDRKSVV